MGLTRDFTTSMQSPQGGFSHAVDTFGRSWRLPGWQACPLLASADITS